MSESAQMIFLDHFGHIRNDIGSSIKKIQVGKKVVMSNKLKLLAKKIRLSSFEHHPPLASCLGSFFLSLVTDCSWMDEQYVASY